MQCKSCSTEILWNQLHCQTCYTPTFRLELRCVICKINNHSTYSVMCCDCFDVEKYERDEIYYYNKYVTRGEALNVKNPFEKLILTRNCEEIFTKFMVPYKVKVLTKEEFVRDALKLSKVGKDLLAIYMYTNRLAFTHTQGTVILSLANSAGIKDILNIVVLFTIDPWRYSEVQGTVMCYLWNTDPIQNIKLYRQNWMCMVYPHLAVKRMYGCKLIDSITPVECCICLEEINPSKETICCTTCGQRMHIECCNKIGNNRCPGCRTIGYIKDYEELLEDSGEGLDQFELSIIQQQCKCSRKRAIELLRKHGNIVDAIIEYSNPELY
jgi:hypothetical protein